MAGPEVDDHHTSGACVWCRACRGRPPERWTKMCHGGGGAPTQSSSQRGVPFLPSSPHRKPSRRDHEMGRGAGTSRVRDHHTKGTNTTQDKEKHMHGSSDRVRFLCISWSRAREGPVGRLPHCPQSLPPPPPFPRLSKFTRGRAWPWSRGPSPPPFRACAFLPTRRPGSHCGCG